MYKLIGHFIIIVFLISIGKDGFSQKTDLVILRNGDQLTGEVKKLDLNILQLKTSSMSTVKIKWYHVGSIVAPDKNFQVELKDGIKLFGGLDTASIANTMKIQSPTGEYNIKSDQVVTITQVKQIFWNKFAGNVKAGINYTKASNVFQNNFGGALSFTDKNYLAEFDFNSIQSTQQDTIYNTKQDYNLSTYRYIRKREFFTLFGRSQKSTELGIENRSSAGMGYGMDLLHVNVARIRTKGGFSANREKAFGDIPSSMNLEGLVNLEVKLFKYVDPEIHLDAHANWYPSFTVAGRHRAEFEVELSVELLKDLFIGLDFYSNYDNKPVVTSSSTNDYGINSSLSYKFGL